MEQSELSERRRKSGLPKSLGQNMMEYPNETTLHGLKYLADGKKSVSERVFWILIFMVSTSCLVYCVLIIAAKWLEYPVTIIDNNKPTQIFEIPFPSVTICPTIKLMRDRFDIEKLSKVLDELSDKMDFEKTEFGRMYVMATQICKRSLKYDYAQPIIWNSSEILLNSLTGERNMPENWIYTLKKISPRDKDVLHACALSTRNDEYFLETQSYENCQKIFSPIITNEGICFTFNTIGDVLRAENLHKEFTYHDIMQESDGWHPETGYKKDNAFPIKAMVKDGYSGINGLYIKLTADLSHRFNFCQPMNLGYKLVLNSPTTYPTTYTFIPIEYGIEHKISLKPKIITTTDSLRSFKPENRQCYFSDEHQLKYYKFYTEQNCRLECYANFSLKLFKYGAPFSSPRDSNITNAELYFKDFGWDLSNYFYSLHMYNEIYNISKDASRFRADSNCDCLPDCSQFEYEYEIDEIDDDLKTSGLNESTTIIHLQFDKPTFTGKTRIELYTFIALVSDFGGLLGLFMGGSIVSLFELCYFLTIRNCGKPRRRTQ